MPTVVVDQVLSGASLGLSFGLTDLLAVAGLTVVSGQSVTLTTGGAIGNQTPLSAAGTLAAPSIGRPQSAR